MVVSFSPFPPPFLLFLSFVLCLPVLSAASGGEYVMEIPLLICVATVVPVVFIRAYGLFQFIDTR